MKHAELKPEFQRYKGRVVVQGDNMEDESGLSAVFADAASSASHIEASKLCDARATPPGAYTQALLYDDDRINPVDTRITVPPERRPVSWSKY